MKCYNCKKEFLLADLYVHDNNRFVCRKCNTEKCLKYRKSTNGESSKLAIKRYNKKNKEKVNVWAKVKYHIKSGNIKRELCKICGEKAEAHHNDYKYPLKIVWLCKKHHKLKHKGIDKSLKICYNGK